MTYVSPDQPPTICFFTAMNANGGVSSCDISDDTSILALGSVVLCLCFLLGLIC